MGFSNVWKSSILDLLIIDQGTTYVRDLKA